MAAVLPACSGLAVLDLGQGMAGSMPGQILADNGADVVKVEPPDGDWSRATPGFAMWNRGKRSVVLDLGEPSARAVLRRLAGEADVVVTSLRPGAAARLGASYGDLSAVNPRLVHCAVSAFGPAPDPAAQAGAPHGGRWYEGHVAAAAGHMVGLGHLSGAAVGQDRAAPLFTVAPVASYGAAMLAVQGILAALLERDRSGEGSSVSTSLLQGMVAFLMRQELARAAGDGDGRSPAGISDAVQAGIELCFMTARCADGRYLQMCARQDRHFLNWMAATGLDELARDPRFARGPMTIPTVEDVRELDAALRERMSRRSADEWMRAFTHEFDVGADPFLTPAEFLEHPQMTANGRVVEVDDPERGRLRQVGPLALFSGTPSTIGRPAPTLGEHTAEVLAELDARRAGGDAPRRAGGRRTPGRPPLDGITVVELAYYIAGPLAGALLAEMGARVIKIEPPDGDPYRRTGLQATKFLHGKESIAVDIKAPEGLAAVHALIGRADVFIHNFRPGVPERLGLDAATLHRLAPRLVYVSASSYGSKGPEAGRTAFHSTPNALVGSGILQAGQGNAPVDDSYPDPGSAIGVATAALLGLHARRVNGCGQEIETTMLATTGYTMSPWLVRPVASPDTTPDPGVPDRGQHGLGALYRLYRCADGYLFVGAVQEREWRALAEALDAGHWLQDPRFADAPARRRNDAALAEALSALLATAPAATWQARCLTAGAPAVVAADRTEEVWLREHGLLLPEEHPAYGPHWRPPVKVSFDRMASRLGPPAAVGEHTRALLAEVGLGDEEVERLVVAGVVRTATGAVPAGTRS